jgi:hypothetical protein
MAGHWPVPAHVAASVSSPVAQLALRQEVSPAGYAQAVAELPSQAPPHDEPSLVHAARVPTGAPVTLAQWPSGLHAWHCPVHASSQQTPSVQKPLVH